jgi:hypothetical protein
MMKWETIRLSGNWENLRTGEVKSGPTDDSVSVMNILWTAVGAIVAFASSFCVKKYFRGKALDDLHPANYSFN